MTTRTRSVGALVPLFLLLCSAASASAQARPGPRSLSRAVDDAHEVARAEAPRAPFTAALGDLGRTARWFEQTGASAPAVMELDAQYRRARRALLQRNLRPSEALLDAWDGVVVAFAHADRRAPQPPVAEAPAHFEMRLRVGTSDVHARGRTPDELFEECRRYVVGSRMPIAGPIVIDGQTALRPRRPLSVDAVCSIGVLGARAIGAAPPELLTGSLGTIPLTLRGPLDTARALVSRYVPMVLAEVRVRSITLAGRRYLRVPRFTGTDAVQLIDAELLRRPPPPPRWGMRE